MTFHTWKSNDTCEPSVQKYTFCRKFPPLTADKWHTYEFFLVKLTDRKWKLRLKLDGARIWSGSGTQTHIYNCSNPSTDTCKEPDQIGEFWFGDERPFLET